MAVRGPIPVVREPTQAVRESQPGDGDVVVVMTHRIYRIRWFRGGACLVTSTVTGSLLGRYDAESGSWDEMGRLPTDVRDIAVSVRPVAR